MLEVFSAHLVAGTPQSVVSSHCILAVVSPDEEDETDSLETSTQVDGASTILILTIARRYVRHRLQRLIGRTVILRPMRFSSLLLVRNWDSQRDVRYVYFL